MSCTDKKQTTDTSEPIITQEIIPDFSMFDKYFTREQLFPIFILQDTIFEDLMDYNMKTDLIEYSNSGQALGYTNKYGLFFLENKKQLVSLQELSNITTPLEGENNRKLEFYYTTVFNATSVEEICTKLEDSVVTLLDIISQNTVQLDRSLEKDNMPSAKFNRNFDTPYYKYILKNAVGENLDQIKNAMLNGLILNLYNFSEYDQSWTDITPILNHAVRKNGSRYPIRMNGTYRPSS